MDYSLSDEPWTDRYIQIDGVETHYIEAGTGEPVVLVHGGGMGSCGAVNYGDVMEPMSAHYRVIAPDLAGFGETPGRCPEDYPAEAQGDFLIEFLKTLNEPVHLGGNSHGGWLVQYVAHEAPELVRRMIIINSLNGCMPIPPAPEGYQYIYHEEGHAHKEPTLEDVRENLMEFYSDTGLVTDERVELFYEMSARNHKFAEKRSAAVTSTIGDANENLSYRGDHISEHADELSLPVLLTWSRENRGATPEDAMPLFNRIDNVEMHIFSGAKHHVQAEYPHAWTNVVQRFLERD
ncbi:alpha/beta fold hydrolase [Natronosalvus rutilus]|uniref:Alpha/beta hydrolase n=1 Tax=Natronosalvus rutilus TaxID=2953753 RepID=A0A9E7SWP4_9EURY|nr:alpha/beta hydrolase [Natronosalvus rutilus]UTF55690.1 alpha/beta hydrolase [Natronosalvus rutilus]